jgi:hypothetical protein
MPKISRICGVLPMISSKRTSASAAAVSRAFSLSSVCRYVERRSTISYSARSADFDR